MFVCTTCCTEFWRLRSCPALLFQYVMWFSRSNRYPYGGRREDLIIRRMCISSRVRGENYSRGTRKIVGSIWEPADHCWPDKFLLVCYYLYNGQTSPSVRRRWVTTCLRCNHRLSDQFLLSRVSIVNNWTYKNYLLFVSCCLFHAWFGPESEQNVKGLSVCNMSYSVVSLLEIPRL